MQQFQVRLQTRRGDRVVNVLAGTESLALQLAREEMRVRYGVTEGSATVNRIPFALATDAECELP